MFLRIVPAFVTIIYTIAPSVADDDAQHRTTISSLASAQFPSARNSILLTSKMVFAKI
ncbi:MULTISPECIES: hypothetical protein [unclassified Microcoleus]|uniref:hypothetical protein n=1 Tax=unclassified Microcoleus TaxID=2642155 RepID=UPI001D811877|nr:MULTISPECIES: hypothetical protein [unclassified Microcoleus]MCC3453930.1 hypothetical protein [Microcoleus sp. PH2017_08_TRC_O_A]MCC3590123.1 hypothetical protein [Microcoleus sp. PH2017_28_MFU_U_A]